MGNFETPLEKYQQDIDAGLIEFDPAQNQAMVYLEEIYVYFTERGSQGSRYSKFLPPYLRRRFSRQPSPHAGLYFWGGVGVGKTYLMDTFYVTLPIERKLRIHFHQFMQRVHKDIKELGNIPAPLAKIATQIAKEAEVICFDEFHVTDITDAMLLSGLLSGLFEEGVSLIFTSNTHPDDLYRDGLQRARFLPAIDLIRQYSRIIEIKAQKDYRLDFFQHAELYHTPLDMQADVMLRGHFEKLCSESQEANCVLELSGRKIETVAYGAHIVWFDFDILCNTPRGSLDYLELATRFNTVLIANIPLMNDADDEPARRFITLIDTLYDHHVKLIVTAAVKPEDLYQGERLRELFQRTCSRLHEMTTNDYLQRQHRFEDMLDRSVLDQTLLIS